MKMSPCKGCGKRTVKPNCHTECDCYLQYVAERQEYYEKKTADNNIYDYIDKAKKRKKIPRKAR